MSSLAYSVPQNGLFSEAIPSTGLARPGLWAASIAHEVNQPLSGIMTNAGTLMRMLNADPPNLDGAREMVLRVIRDSKRASDVIARTNSLFAQRHNAGELMDLNNVAEEVIAMAMQDLDRGKVLLCVELADDLPLISGDRVQLQQVILNLLRNASDAMSTVHGRPRRLTVRTGRTRCDMVRLSVEDSGIGLDPSKAERLFEPFFTTKTTGMGLGLSVSRAIIESHRGRLWATRNHAAGATFSFVIPCALDGIAEVDDPLFASELAATA